MKGHVGGGARSGDLRVPDTGLKYADALTFRTSSRSVGSDMSFVSITFDKCRHRLPKFDIAVGGSKSLEILARAVVS
jgi:hypothetical protein